jgi:hypothetical protein
MRQRAYIDPVTILSVLLAIYVVPGQAQNESFCLSKASDVVNPGERVEIIDSQMRSWTGRLLSVDPLSDTITIVEIGATRVERYTFASAQINGIKYWKPGRVRPSYCLGGLLVGMIIGHIVDREIIDPGTDKALFPEDFTSHGGFIGSLAGLTLGAVVSLATSSPRIIGCR